MIDIHSHILPYLDDGAKSLEQSLKMLEIAAKEGITEIIATPHCYGHKKSATPQMVHKSIIRVRKELQQENIPIRLYVGNEIYYRQGVEEELEKGNINTLAGSRYVLVEFHPEEDYQYILRGLNNLKCYGYFPILAHVERYENLFTKKGRIEDLKNTGVQMQINASSIMAKGFTNTYRSRSLSLLKSQMVDYVATDAHSDRNRAPFIQACEVFLQKKAGREYTQKVLVENAEHIIACSIKRNIREES